MDFIYELFINWGFSDSVSRVVSFFLFEIMYLSTILMIGLTVFTFIRVRFLGNDFAEKLQKKPKWLVYLGMALLGIISPFCSCSTIPVFVSFSALGVPTGALFVFLITSPMVQEASLILLLTEFGIPVAIVYVLLGVLAGMIVGTIISRAKDSDLFNESVLAKRENRQSKVQPITVFCCDNVKPSISSCCGDTETSTQTTSCCDDTEGSTVSSCCGSDDGHSTREIDPKRNPLKYSMNEAVAIMKRTFKFIVIGIAVGSFIYGLVPEELIQNLLGTSNTIAPVLATLVGIPIYADDVALIPIAKTLVDAGAGLGTALAFVMSSAVVSIPSFIMLGAALKKKTLVKLAASLSILIIIIGYIFNFISPFIM